MPRTDFPTEQVRANLQINGVRTTFSLEVAVWAALRTMCADNELSLDGMIERIVARAEPGASMASAVRTSVLEHFMEKSR